MCDGNVAFLVNCPTISTYQFRSKNFNAEWLDGPGPVPAVKVKGRISEWTSGLVDGIYC